MLNRRVCGFWGLIATLAIVTGEAQAGLLGPAQDYNLFILGDANQLYSDAEGRVAVGGNAYYSGYSFASKLPTNTTNSLVVGGNLNFSNGTIHGDLHVGGTANLSGVNVTGGTFYDKPIDFAAAGTSLTALSTYLATQSSTGSVGAGALGLTLTGTSSGLNVFNLTAAQFASANNNGLNIVSLAGSTILINVDGTSPSLANFQMYVNGSASETNPLINNILFNFSKATSLTDTNVSIYGSVLAPGAALRFDYNHINGTLVGASLTGHVEAHNYPFGGTLPQAVPEPSSLTLMGICGLVLLFSPHLRRGFQGAEPPV
ncbi:choice-of-anchor A domain-containing protein [Singulisphaera sp. GP187]|uniref:choice-of-anchor A family protein n=1 Tax=Singulisphaera sp. GP187 TaxID=1882752 RepID=UPI00092CCDDD|nr:choice-of-anchor A family protein [Singulisphaera sp. GP187]SIO44660.1 choice-of-anchor A domain-containing protein [Singulisphaera sp. GP187]